MGDNSNILDSTNGTIVFQFFQRSRPTFINLKRSRPFNDIFFRLLFELDNQGRSPHDVHLYINSVDITEALREEIIGILEEDANDFIRESYKNALERHILMYGQTNESIEQMKARARELIAQPLTCQFTERIGDSAHGWSGHLGLVNFLYREVGFPEISLLSVVARHNNGNRPVIDLQAQDILTLTFTHGLVGTLDPLPRGQLSFEIVLDRVNPLLARLVAAEKRISELNEVAGDLLQRITSLTGAIQRTDSRVATIANELSSTSRELHEFVELSNTKQKELDIYIQRTDNRVTSIANELSSTSRELHELVELSNTKHKEMDLSVSNIKEELKKRENKIIMKAQDGRETIHIDGEKGDIRLI